MLSSFEQYSRRMRISALYSQSGTQLEQTEALKRFYRGDLTFAQLASEDKVVWDFLVSSWG